MVDWGKHWTKLRDDIDGGRKTEITASDFKPKPGIFLQLFIRALVGPARFGILSGLAKRMSDANNTVASRIPENRFNTCLNLESVEIPQCVELIQRDAFNYCWNLKKEVTIPDGVKTIGKQAFYWCESLECVTIPGSVDTISDSAFHMCCALTNVTILDGVKTIEDKAFNGCKNLTTVTIPDSVKTIGKQAFLGYQALKYIITNNKLLLNATDEQKGTWGIIATCEIITPSERLKKTDSENMDRPMQRLVRSVGTAGRCESTRSNELAKAFESSSSFSYTAVLKLLASLLKLDKKPSNTPVGRLTGPQ